MRKMEIKFVGKTYRSASIGFLPALLLLTLPLVSAAQSEKIAFYSQRDGNNEIYLMNVDGTILINLSKKHTRLSCVFPHLLRQ